MFMFLVMPLGRVLTINSISLINEELLRTSMFFLNEIW